MTQISPEIVLVIVVISATIGIFFVIHPVVAYKIKIFLKKKKKKTRDFCNMTHLSYWLSD